MVEILCIHIHKWKNETIDTILGMEERGLKENDGGYGFNYDMIRPFVNVTMYPSTKLKKEKEN
jgi:hypothetical protein